MTYHIGRDVDNIANYQDVSSAFLQVCILREGEPRHRSADVEGVRRAGAGGEALAVARLCRCREQSGDCPEIPDHQRASLHPLSQSEGGLEEELSIVELQ
jgi:hypothetical protein